MNPYPIVFVRHAESEANVYIHKKDPDADKYINNLGDPELSQLGRQQSEAVGRSLINSLKEMGNPVINVLVSQFIRTQQTSEYFIKNYANIDEVIITTELLEYTPSQTRFSQAHLDSGLSHDTSWEDFKRRIIKFAETYMSLSHDKPIIVFGHSMFISCLVTYISSNRTFFPQKDELCFRFPNCSVTTFLWDDIKQRWLADHVASIAHMPKHLITGTHTPFGNSS